MKRDYKDEYRKYGKTKKAKKYRAELNKYNVRKGRMVTVMAWTPLTKVVESVVSSKSP